MKCTHVCAAQKLINSLPNNKFPSLADEIAEPCPDMNIKVAAFTISNKSINAYLALAILNVLTQLISVKECPTREHTTTPRREQNQ